MGIIQYRVLKPKLLLTFEIVIRIHSDFKILLSFDWDSIKIFLTYSGIPGRTTFIYVTSVGKICEKYSSINNVLTLFIYVGFTSLNIS